MKGDGVQVMNGVNDAASRGADWDNLLTEMLAALHKIAMLQLLPVQDNSAGVTEERLRILAGPLPGGSATLLSDTAGWPQRAAVCP